MKMMELVPDIFVCKWVAFVNLNTFAITAIPVIPIQYICIILIYTILYWYSCDFYGGLAGTSASDEMGIYTLRLNAF